MNNWKIQTDRPGGPEGFRYAIVGRKDRVVAWVANKLDAEFVAKADRKISGLRSESSRHRVLWLGSVAQRATKR